MRALAQTADDVLRRTDWTARDEPSLRSWLRLLACLIGFGIVYGAAMGTYRLSTGQSQWLLQLIYSAIKVPILLTVSFVINLPSFFVLSTLLGLRKDFALAVRAIVAAQAGLAVVLAALAPLTLLCYASSAEYDHALLFNGAIFATASLAAQFLLRRFYRPLIARNPRHRQLLIGWGCLYVLVAIQLAWLLRPFIGSAGVDVQFLRPEAWDNAYEVLLRLVWRALFS